ncbi:MAG: hypothetical protein FJ027_11820 [Candidatus Rokubacteria bacterium]|nr:hypothetical protein [Candidatus Rokubacteria bacterium]
MPRRAIRSWISIAMLVQLAGYAFDALWHGVLFSGDEPATVPEMIRHLATVHAALYAGVAGLLIGTAVALAYGLRRGAAGVALPVAFGGALLSTAAEAWHAASHLALDTHAGRIAGGLSFAGYLVVVAAMWLWRGKRGRGRRARNAGRAAKARRAA